MKKILLLSLAIVSSLFAQTPVNVQKGGSAGTNNITSDLNIGTGRTLTIASGATLTVASGATFSFPAGTIPWTAITSTPTTLAGYGIADGVSTAGSYANPSWITSLAATKLTGTIAGAQMPAFTGDISSSAGSLTTTLATVNANTGSWGTATAVPTFTVNGKGLITAAANTTISIPSTAISDSTSTGRALLTAGSAALARTTLGLATVAATGSYTDLSNQPTFNSFSPMTTLGDTIYENATPAGARLAGNTTTTNKFLSQVGNGSISAAPAWNALVNGDVPTTLSGKTYNGLTLTALSTGFTVAGGTTSKTLTVPLDASVSGTNTGDQTISITGDVTASGSTGALASTVVKINGVTLSGLATGILKNTTATGVPSIAVAGTDYQAPGSYITALTGDATASGPGSATATVVKVNGVAYGTSPSTNTVPVVTGANTVTYQTVPNAALANSTVTIGSTSTSLGGTSATIAGLTLTAPVINGATSSGSTAINLSSNSGAFSSPTGANSLGGAVTVNDATTPSVTLASGKTNTGFYQVNGKTSGALKITAADSAAQTVTVNLAAQTTGAATLTIPDQAGTSRNLVTDTGTATLTNKTFGASNTVSTGFSYTAGVTQTFAPNATNSGLNVGSQAGVPSSLNNGDIFYDSTANALKARSNGSTITLGAGGSGTVTNTGGALTANALVLGAGGNDTKVVGGVVSDGTSGLTLGVAGTSVGSVGFNNATSGKVTLQPVTGALGSVTLSLPAATDTLVGKATTDTLTNKTITSLVNSGAITIPTGTDTLVARATTDTLTNKTINGSSNTLTVLAASQLSGIAPTANGGNAVDLTLSAPAVIGGFGRNRLQNAGMILDFTNAGASTTAATFNGRMAERWNINTQTSLASSSIQQVTDAPTGLSNSIKFTVGTGAAPAAGDYNQIVSYIEGSDVKDFSYGTASATVNTLSFWVKSSLTGTFATWSGNSAANRCFLGQYTISSANTWEKKSITYTGDTSGTWLNGVNTIGISIGFDLGCGTTQEGTSSVWQAGALRRVSGNVRVVATTGATFQVTGVQFERGAQATDFEFEPIAQTSLKCKRYHWRVSDTAATNYWGVGGLSSTTAAECIYQYEVEMLSVPTISFSAAGNFFLRSNTSNFTPSSIGTNGIGTRSCSINVTIAGGTTGTFAYLQWQTGTAYIDGANNNGF